MLCELINIISSLGITCLSLFKVYLLLLFTKPKLWLQCDTQETPDMKRCFVDAGNDSKKYQDRNFTSAKNHLTGLRRKKRLPEGIAKHDLCHRKSRR